MLTPEQLSLLGAMHQDITQLKAEVTALKTYKDESLPVIKSLIADKEKLEAEIKTLKLASSATGATAPIYGNTAASTVEMKPSPTPPFSFLQSGTAAPVANDPFARPPGTAAPFAMPAAAAPVANSPFAMPAAAAPVANSPFAKFGMPANAPAASSNLVAQTPSMWGVRGQGFGVPK
jgi:hypothetical protein